MTTEMPPSGMVDVNVVVTFFDDTGVLVWLVDEATVGVALDVSRVVPLDVASAVEHVSKVSPRFRDSSSRLCANVLRYEEHIQHKAKKMRLKPGSISSDRYQGTIVP